jgi:[NiFe] hydrogenase assembly HybE family chaperone
MSVSVAQLVERFEQTYRDHMEGLPIVNEALQVDAIGFRDFEDHRLGVLVTPWFMNLVLLPGTDAWSDATQGDLSTIAFPSGPIEFTVCHDDVLGTYLSAVLFTTVADVPDQAVAQQLALDVMAGLDRPPHETGKISRRSFFTGLRNS